jgi:tetratricopeptide (TPR) repeat protein
MSEQSVKLYGYQKEQGQIEAAIAEKGTLRFLCVHGPGGIGKTTMLHAVREKYQADEDYRITGLLDFDDLRLHVVENVLYEIAKQLQTEQMRFEDYFEAVARLRDMQREGVSHLNIEDQEARTKEAFIRDYWALVDQQRAILLFDTVEKVQDFSLWRALVDLLMQLENTVVLLAGRRNDEVGDSLEWRLKPPDSAQVIPLQGLSDTESLAYFKRTELGGFLAAEDPAQADLVARLSAGRPILIDLAVDWLRHGIGLPKPDKATDGLDEASLREIQQDFEQKLVEGVKDLAEPRNEAILEMAHIYHYFDAERYCHLHEGVSLDEARELLDELRSFSFIKRQPGGGIRLHDEMQRMVEQYVWPVLDRNHKRRRWLSQRLGEFYEELLANRDYDPAMRQALTAEQLYHRLYADIKEGHSSFRVTFRLALSQQHIGFAHVLLNTLGEFSTDFDPELEAWFDAHRGRLLRAEEEVEEAVPLIRSAKDRLQQLGVREELDTICNALGYCYRLMGDWERAITAYEEALVYSREEWDVPQIAETMNNIANTCRLSGDFERANRYSLVSLEIRERLGGEHKRALGNSCYVRGMISWETGNSLEAVAYLRRARVLYSEVDHTEGVADVDKYAGYMRFRIGDTDGALHLIRQAQAVFDEKGIGLGLADALNIEARVLIDKHAAEGDSDEGFREIESVAQHALSAAERIQDNYKIAECRLTLCRTYYRWGRFWQEQDQMAKAQKCYLLAHEQYQEGGRLAHQRNYWALWSVYEWTMGDLAFEAGEWDTAFDRYLRECETAARFKAARYARALNGLSDRLHRIYAVGEGYGELTRYYCDYVIAAWKGRGLDREFPEVIEECEQVKTFLGLVDPQHLEQLRQWGADLLDRGEWQQALEVCQELLEAGQSYRPDEEVAWAMNQSARAYRQMGELVQARRLCQQSLLIRQELKDKAAIASSRLVMSGIMWTNGNTNEAARYVRLARQMYEQVEDKVGKARANRHAAYLYFGIGDHEPAREYLAAAESTFRKKRLYADLAEALNLHAVALRRDKRFEEAREFAHESRQLAEENGVYYTIAEAWLTLGLIEYDEGRERLKKNEKEKAQDHFDRTKSLLGRGYPIAERYSYDLLLSVYESTLGGIAFTEGRYVSAFEHYVKDLEFGARFERARMRRELDRVVDALVQLPAEMIRFYADYIILEWQKKGLPEVKPDISDLFQLLKEYREYVQAPTQ